MANIEKYQAEERVQPALLRLEGVPATPRNLERIGERVDVLNRRLAESGAPFRLRLLEGDPCPPRR